MRLLADTDIFCKLAATGLLVSAASLLGGQASSVERLPALPRMLRKGSLRKMLGEELADKLIPLAESMPTVPVAPAGVAELIANKPNIDVGEVQLFAAAANDTVLLMSGDKRALNAVASEQTVVPLLDGKIVCLEAIMLALCDKLGAESIRAAVGPHASLDKVFSICFSPGNQAPDDCLRSYLADLQAAVKPLVLWMP